MLAELVWQKTKGIPFFVNEFLQLLYSENLLVCNPSNTSELKGKTQRGYWQWNIKKIAAINHTDNVVEFMIGKMKTLPISTQEVLSLAACMGAEFNINTISIICEKSALEVFKSLNLAIARGLILTSSELDEELVIQFYKFGHDRIQQAAYLLMDEEHKPFVHLKIGRLLCKNTHPEDFSEKIFEIIDHLNLGLKLITCQQERNKIVKLNVLAAQKAKAATAYEAALKYLNVANELLTENSWQTNYNLTLNLYSEAAEVAYLSGDFGQMEQFASVVLQQAKTLLD